MAHNIFGKRFVGARTPAWHRLGTVIPEDQEITVKEALKIGGIDFNYLIVPIGYTLPDGTFVTSGQKQIILREPTDDDPEWAEMGLVSDNYHLMQNRDLAEGLDVLAKQTGWKFETVGALGKGDTVFMTLRTGTESVFGDNYDTYVILSDGKGNGRGLQLVICTTRVVCQNTLMMSDAAANKIIIPHGAGVSADYDWWITTIGGLEQSRQDFFTRLRKLADTEKISDRQAQSVINAAFPLPQLRDRTAQVQSILDTVNLTAAGRAHGERQTAQDQEHFDFWTKKQGERREASFDCYKRLNAGEEQGAQGGRMVTAETLAQIKNTPYAVVQAVAEVVDWGGREGNGTAYRAIFGEGVKVKARALTKAEALIK
jgi:phage/plasmid-like protein (TIGR03299 family)